MAKKSASSMLTGGKSKPSARRTIRCYFCAHAHDVSERTMSTTCPKCNKAIKVEDVVVKSYVPVIDLQTCGTITITKRGRVAATRLQASEGVHCDGSVEGSIESGGPIELGATAVWKGRYLFSSSLTVEDGAQLHGNITVPANPQEAAQDVGQNATVSTTKPADTPVRVAEARPDTEEPVESAPPMLTSSTRRPPTPRVITPAVPTPPPTTPDGKPMLTSSTRRPPTPRAAPPAPTPQPPPTTPDGTPMLTSSTRRPRPEMTKPAPTSTPASKSPTTKKAATKPTAAKKATTKAATKRGITRKTATTPEASPESATKKKVTGKKKSSTTTPTTTKKSSTRKKST